MMTISIGKESERRRRKPCLRMTLVQPLLLVLWCCTFLSRSQVCPAEEMASGQPQQEQEEEEEPHGRRLSSSSRDETIDNRQPPTEPPGVDCWDMDRMEATCGPSPDWRQAFAPYRDGVCRCYQPPAPLTGPQARIAYLIIAHNARTMDDAAYLFRAIRFPNSIILIHVDTKCPMSVYHESQLRQEVEHCPCGATVLVDSVHSSAWSEWTMNEPTLWSMDLLVHDKRFRHKWDVYINLSGDTMPVLTPDRLAKLFAGPLRNTNFVTSASCETGLLPSNVYIFPKGWHKRKVYTHFGDKQFHHYESESSTHKTTTAMVGYFGSQWMVLTHDFVTHVAKEMKRKGSLTRQWRDFLVETKLPMTDETFFPTILMHTYPFNETLPQVNGEEGNLVQLPSMYAIRYERMDEHMPSAFGYVTTQQRYTVPLSSAADTPKVWGPYFLGAYDLYNIKASGALFARKVSVHVDPNIVHLLPVRHVSELPDIQWPTEVKVEDMVAWVRAAKFGEHEARQQMEKEKNGDKRKEGDKDKDKKKKEKEEGGNEEADKTPKDEEAKATKDFHRKRKRQGRRLQEEENDEGDYKDDDDREEEDDEEEREEYGSETLNGVADGGDATQPHTTDSEGQAHSSNTEDEGVAEAPNGGHASDAAQEHKDSLEGQQVGADKSHGGETAASPADSSENANASPTDGNGITWFPLSRGPPPTKARRDGSTFVGRVALYREDVEEAKKQ